MHTYEYACIEDVPAGGEEAAKPRAHVEVKQKLSRKILHITYVYYDMVLCTGNIRAD